MEQNKELETFILQALLEVERDLSLPNNWLVDDMPAQRSSGEVEHKKMVVSF